MVGSTIAYAGIISQLAADIVLIDIDPDKCKGEVLDLQDSLGFCNGQTNISSGSMTDLGTADIIIIAAGARQKPGQSRLDLLTINTDIVASIINHGKPFKSTALIMVITNPVDILTQSVFEQSGLPANQVFSTGTYLDTIRINHLLAQELDVPVQDIKAFVIGEHGDSQVVAWKAATIGGWPLVDFPSATEEKLKSVEKRAIGMANEIISCKGATHYGIAMAAVRLCSIIINDSQELIPLSFYQPAYGVCLSMPVLLGKSGLASPTSLVLSMQEKEKLANSASAIKKYSKG